MTSRKKIEAIEGIEEVWSENNQWHDDIHEPDWWASCEPGWWNGDLGTISFHEGTLEDLYHAIQGCLERDPR